MSELNGKEMGGSAIEVSLAKQPSERKRKRKYFMPEKGG